MLSSRNGCAEPPKLLELPLPAANVSPAASDSGAEASALRFESASVVQCGLASPPTRTRTFTPRHRGGQTAAAGSKAGGQAAVDRQLASQVGIGEYDRRQVWRQSRKRSSDRWQEITGPFPSQGSSSTHSTAPAGYSSGHSLASNSTASRICIGIPVSPELVPTLPALIAAKTACAQASRSSARRSRTKLASEICWCLAATPTSVSISDSRHPNKSVRARVT